MKSRGYFISLEGTEGVGKSSNLAFIERWLKDAGVDVVTTREPGGTPLAEELRELLLAQRQEPVDSNAELLMVFAARAQHLAQVIQPNIEAGRWVLSDRFTDATYAYQGSGRGLPWSTIEALEKIVQNGLQPDLTLLLDVPVEIGLSRIQSRDQSDRFEEEKVEFFEKVREGYRRRLTQMPKRFGLIDASLPLADVQAQIEARLQTFLSEKM